ncbi:portal protein [Hyphomicrobium sp. ghe19]|uniref:portal protein n=1 Tax=Hyphomicrobium sp. ghe19 TaxID=2682968 RepID=UPI0030CE1EB7
MARYEELTAERSPVLARARQAATLTVPHLLPPEGHSGATELPTPFQSMGARGVRNLSSKLLLTQFPPNVPFFKYDPDEYIVEAIVQKAGIEGRGEVEKALSRRERSVCKESDKLQFRPAAFEAFRQLLVAGNVLLHTPEDGIAQTFRLDRFVVKRDWGGKVLEIVLKQTFSPSSLPLDAQAIIQGQDGKPTLKTVDLYTYIKWDGKKFYEVFQEVEGHVIPSSRGKYKEDRCPWLALRLSKIDGEDYGRGYVEECLGDLISLEGLSQTMVEGSAAAAKIVILVNPNGVTREDDISQAENGDVKTGKADDVHVLQADKRGDFAVVESQIEKLEQRLAYMFLLNASVQRQGERVTAEEIRYMAQDLEDALGGMYTVLAQEFQLPLVSLFSARMEKRKGVPKLPKELNNPTITTGVDALGRGQDLKNLDNFLIGLGENFGPEVIGRYVNFSEAIKRRAAALGIDTEGLIKSEQEVQQAEQQAQMTDLATNLGPDAIKAMANVGGNQLQADAKVKAAQLTKRK